MKYLRCQFLHRLHRISVVWGCEQGQRQGRNEEEKTLGEEGHGESGRVWVSEQVGKTRRSL
jgi:hypothetical protein